MLLFVLDFFHDLLLLLEFELAVVADGLVVLQAVVADYQSLVLLVLLQLLTDLLPLLLLLLLHLTHLLLPCTHLLALRLVFGGGERVGLEEVEFVAGGEEGEFGDGFNGLSLVGF